MQITSILITTDWSFPTSWWVVQVMVANSSYALPAADFYVFIGDLPEARAEEVLRRIDDGYYSNKSSTAGGEQVKSADDKVGGRRIEGLKAAQQSTH